MRSNNFNAVSHFKHCCLMCTIFSTKDEENMMMVIMMLIMLMIIIKLRTFWWFFPHNYNDVNTKSKKTYSYSLEKINWNYMSFCYFFIFFSSTWDFKCLNNKSYKKLRDFCIIFLQKWRVVLLFSFCKNCNKIKKNTETKLRLILRLNFKVMLLEHMMLLINNRFSGFKVVFFSFAKK